MPGHFTPPEANFYYTMVYILPAEILFSVLTYVGIGTLTSYLKLLMFQPPQLRQHSHLPTRPTPNSNGNINTIAHSILCIYPINLSSSHSHRRAAIDIGISFASTICLIILLISQLPNSRSHTHCQFDHTPKLLFPDPIKGKLRVV